MGGERRYDDAIVHHQRALTIGRNIGHRFGEAAALGDLAHVYNQLGRYLEAAEHSRQALGIYREIGHQRNQAVNLTNLGNALRGMGHLDQALTHLQQGLNIFTTIGATGGQAWPLRCIAKVYHQQGHSDHAVDCLRQAAALECAGHRAYDYAMTLGDLGTVLNDIGRPREARDAWNEALSILNDLDPHQADQIRKHLNASGPVENNFSEAEVQGLAGDDARNHCDSLHGIGPVRI
ncbi:tetratricopeptide repeat protein [Amycolatopsis halotolerans]|uniref:Tetratricopeptide repeat protein n=1 Tax=Amycolatopsis halotolerans TaxID=330083 RepID=A0ABV7QNZ2_9PSEU